MVRFTRLCNKYIYIYIIIIIIIIVIIIKVEVTEKLEASKARIEQRAALLAEREQKLVMQRMEANLDRDAKAELADNSWLKEQVNADI